MDADVNADKTLKSALQRYISVLISDKSADPKNANNQPVSPQRQESFSVQKQISGFNAQS